MATVIVTGSSRGIGRATALRSAEDGYDVVVNYVSNGDAAAEVVEEIEERTDRDSIAVQADVSEYDAAERLVEITVSEFGGVDHVVNNAGIDQHLHTADLSPEDFEHVMKVNLNGAFHVSKAALEHLYESTVPEGPSICNMSSIAAYTGASIECHYSASKSGLVGLTKSHAQDFAPKVRVNAIAPGDIETEMLAGRSEEHRQAQLERIPLNRFGQPGDIAETAAFLREAAFVTGETVHVNGGELMY
ncbi:SDR family NAD(P)-dependent oxidoreductase [Haloplanus salilacus]|uniref:SDR family NAD(P)-dependent oxidoreductase n=1 Tax=Haloplanus salilacus TaxID=2949994 RepID=UPI0030CBAC7E